MSRKGAHRWKPLSDSKPSLSTYIKVFFSLITISQAKLLSAPYKSPAVVKNQCNDDCNYNFTSDMFSDGTNNYLSRLTGGFESCGDTAKKFYDRNIDSITQIQQGQLCLGESASYPYLPMSELLWQMNIPQCPGDADCYALSLYSAKNATLNMKFVTCVETTFSQNQDQFNNDVAECQKKKFNYGWLLIPGLVFLSIIGYLGKRYCFKDIEDEDYDPDDDDYARYYLKYHSRHSFSQEKVRTTSDSGQSLQGIRRYTDEDEEEVDNSTTTTSSYSSLN